MKILSVLVGLWGLAAWASPLAPKEETPSPPKEASGQPRLSKSPSLLESAPAAFPPEMEAEQKSGTVVLELEIDEEGKVRNVAVLESAGQAFDMAAVEAAWKYRFSPAEVDDKPAPVRIHYRSEFFFRPPEDTSLEALPDDTWGELSGELIERGTRLPIVEALVVLGEGDNAQETFSDKDGRFSFSELPAGKWKLSVSSPGHERLLSEESISPGKRTQVRLHIKKKTYGAFQTTVHGTKDKREVSQVSLQQEEIRLIPGTQGDAFKVLFNLPGVARTPFGLGMLVVRGARPYDTRVYIDDVHIPILFHFGGFISTVNSATLERLDFEPGNFGAAYGRSMGGLVKGNIRAPASSGLHGYVDINLIDSSALFEGPVGKGWSVLASGRRSYIDVLLPVFMKRFSSEDEMKLTVSPRYYNYQLRAEHRSEEKNSRFFVYVFGADDKFKMVMPNAKFDVEGRNSFGTTTRFDRIAVGWERRFSDKLFFKTRNSAGYDARGIAIGKDVFYDAKQFPITTRNEFSFTLSENTTLRVGADVSYKFISYDVQVTAWPTPNQIPNPIFSQQLLHEKGKPSYFEPAIYAEVQHSPFEGFQVVGGLRADYSSQIRKAWVDPRLAISQSFAERFKIKGAIGLFQQPPDYENGQSTKTYGNPNLKHESTVQSSAGFEVKITKAIDLDVQAYSRYGYNMVRQVPGGGAQANLDVEDTKMSVENSGHSRGYGMEVLLRHQLTDRFFGWIAYGLSRSELTDILNGGYRRSMYDQPHHLIVVASYKLPGDWVLGGKVRYTSGSLSTPVVGTIVDVNGGYYFPLDGRLNSERLPSYFQLDVRLDKRFVFNNWMLSVYVDLQNLQNVAGRKNVEFPGHSYDYSERENISGLPLLPVFGVRAEF